MIHLSCRRKLWDLIQSNLREELLQGNQLPERSVVCDLGSGQGLTSVFLAKEYGFTRICS